MEGICCARSAVGPSASASGSFSKQSTVGLPTASHATATTSSAGTGRRTLIRTLAKRSARVAELRQCPPRPFDYSRPLKTERVAVGRSKVGS